MQLFREISEKEGSTILCLYVSARRNFDLQALESQRKKLQDEFISFMKAFEIKTKSINALENFLKSN
jgi:hypothetical protein